MAVAAAVSETAALAQEMLRMAAQAVVQVEIQLLDRLVQAFLAKVTLAVQMRLEVQKLWVAAAVAQAKLVNTTQVEVEALVLLGMGLARLLVEVEVEVDCTALRAVQAAVVQAV
jgi:hypothetical protein